MEEISLALAKSWFIWLLVDLALFGAKIRRPGDRWYNYLVAVLFSGALLWGIVYALWITFEAYLMALQGNYKEFLIFAQPLEVFWAMQIASCLGAGYILWRINERWLLPHIVLWPILLLLVAELCASVVLLIITLGS